MLTRLDKALLTLSFAGILPAVYSGSLLSVTFSTSFFIFAVWMVMRSVVQQSMFDEFMEAHRAQVQRILKSLPPEERARVEERLRQLGYE